MTESLPAAPRVAVAGAGHLGDFHLDKLAILEREGHARLAAVVDIDRLRAETAAARYGCDSAASFAELDMELDAVVIATPTATHAELTVAALGRRWDVLVEKPIAPSVAEASRMVEAAAEHGRLLQVGHNERFNPAIAAALRLADRPRYIVAERLGPFTGRSHDVDVVLDLMIHDLDLVASLVAAELREVRAIGVPILTDAIDMAAVRLEFADGAVAQLSAGRASLEPSRKLRLFTVERYLSVDTLAGEVKSVRRLPPAPGERWPQIAGEPVEVANADALLEQDRAFLHCVTTRSPPPADGRAGLRALRLAEAVKAQLRIPLPG